MTEEFASYGKKETLLANIWTLSPGPAERSRPSLSPTTHKSPSLIDGLAVADS